MKLMQQSVFRCIKYRIFFCLCGESSGKCIFSTARRMRIRFGCGSFLVGVCLSMETPLINKYELSEYLK